MDDRGTPHAGMGFGQFVAMMAALMAANALAIDMMLPALGRIGADFGLAAGNERQWVVTAYLLGFGAAQIVYGTLADRFGRKPTVLAGLAVYVAATLACAFAGSFAWLIAARVAAGIGAAGSAVLAISIIRDCYAGSRMARVMSLSFLVFLAVPVFAPSLGQLIILVAPWSAIFLGLAAYGAAVFVWVWRKLPETLHERDRRPIAVAEILAAAQATLTNRVSLGYTLASALVIGAWVGFLNSAQQIFADIFRAPALFTLVFAMLGGGIALASLLNARLVNHVGMRRISHAALLGMVAIAALQAAMALGLPPVMWRFSLVQVAVMFCFGLSIGNFSALAMEPLGHIAGAAASIQGFVSIVSASLIGLFIGQAFNGTLIPLTISFALCGALSLLAVAWAERGRLLAGAVAEPA